MELMELLSSLLCAYGPQGWWPLPSKARQGSRNEGGYLRGPSVCIGSRENPDDSNARFEIAVGSMLAQNTAWVGASRSLVSFSHKGLLDPINLIESTEEELHSCIKTAGIYIRKAGYLLNLP